jgi:hypothetical protein
MFVLYSDIESQIVTRLQPLTNGGGVDVVQLPQVQAEFERPLNAGRVTIAYKSSEFPSIRSTHEIVQDEHLQFEVIVQCRLLRGNAGLHKIVETTKRLLLGFRPTDCSKMYLVKHGFTSHDNEGAIWTYSMIFETKYVLVEDAQEETGPNLEEILFEYNDEYQEPVTPPTCEPVVISNSAGSVIGTSPAGVPFVLDDTVYNIVVNGEIIETIMLPTLEAQTINIVN